MPYNLPIAGGMCLSIITLLVLAVVRNQRSGLHRETDSGTLEFAMAWPEAKAEMRTQFAGSRRDYEGQANVTHTSKDEHPIRT
jgi:hypothetical protein